MENSTVLVTGGTGSFGGVVTRRLIERGVREVRVFSRDELKQHEMRRELGGLPVSFYLGDVRDPASLAPAMNGVRYVFHAAALKQVPSCEFFPLEAVNTNTIGSQNVLRAAQAAGVERVVLLSTDKAVTPVNAMGMSKALMEKIGLAFARSNPTGPVVSIVRYGNVMLSRGSVIPTFMQQVQSGIPLTVTNPQMTRFLMPLADAVTLVEYALERSETGDLFIKKAPAATIADLASAVLRICGQPEHPVRTIGTRHAEKLYETLATGEELARGTDEGAFYRIPVDARDLNYEVFYDEGMASLDGAEDYHSHNTDRLSIAETQALIVEAQAGEAKL